MNPEGHRRQLLEGLREFVTAARRIEGVRRISVLGSMLTTKADPKDVDLLLVVTDDADLTPLAKCGRRLKGHAQSINRGADVFLADERGQYIGRTCHWRDCRPGIRASCDARHCGQRPYLHDDLMTSAWRAPWSSIHRSRCGPRSSVGADCRRTSRTS